MISDRDSMEALVGECVVASFDQFQIDLERRIAVVLYQKNVLTPAVRTNLAQAVSRDIAQMLLAKVFESGQMHDTLQRLL